MLVCVRCSEQTPQRTIYRPLCPSCKVCWFERSLMALYHTCFMEYTAPKSKFHAEAEFPHVVAMVDSLTWDSFLLLCRRWSADLRQSAALFLQPIDIIWWKDSAEVKSSSFLCSLSRTKFALHHSTGLVSPLDVFLSEWCGTLWQVSLVNMFVGMDSGCYKPDKQKTKMNSPEEAVYHTHTLYTSLHQSQ